MKSAALLRSDLESALGARITGALKWRERLAQEFVPAGIAEFDALTGGLPRGAITDIHGQTSSGRTSLMTAILAAATARGEICGLVDASDAFDPATAAAAGVRLDSLLWVRCGGNPEHALKVADLLMQGGGFGLVALDLCDVPAGIARRVPIATWFRLRRAIENTPTVLVVLEQEHSVKSCASLSVEMRREGARWRGARGCSRLLAGAYLEVRKPAGSERIRFGVKAAE
jgi:recombination protein RecA